MSSLLRAYCVRVSKRYPAVGSAWVIGGLIGAVAHPPRVSSAASVAGSNMRILFIAVRPQTVVPLSSVNARIRSTVRIACNTTAGHSSMPTQSPANAEVGEIQRDDRAVGQHAAAACPASRQPPRRSGRCRSRALPGWQRRSVPRRAAAARRATEQPATPAGGGFGDGGDGKHVSSQDPLVSFAGDPVADSRHRSRSPRCTAPDRG